MPRLYIKQLSCYLSLFACLLALQVRADVFEHPVVDSSKAPALEAVVSRLAAATLVRSQFRQAKTMRILQRPLVSQGLMIYQQDLGLYWQVSTPFPSVLMINNQRIVQRNGDEVVTITAADNPAVFGFAQVFFQLLSSDVDKLSTQFEIYFCYCDNPINAEVSNQRQWQIGLLPRDLQLRKAISQVVLTGVEDIEIITLSDHAGDKTVIQFLQRKIGGDELSAEELEHFAD